MLLYIIILIIALISIIKAADWFLKSVYIVGQRLRLSPFIIGVVLIGFGTSLPELATSLSSIFSDVHNVAIANIIGSNMANILLIIGISTLFLGTIKFKKNLINLDLPHLFCISLLFGVLIIDGQLQLFDSLLLLTGFVGYLLYNLSQKSITNQDKNLPTVIKNLFKKPTSTSSKFNYEGNFTYVVLLLIISITLLALASRLAITSMLEIASIINIGIEVMTFITIALGTSLPELSITFKALKQNRGDLVLGNIVGSSVFNILLVGGVAGVVHTQFIDASVLYWSVAGLIIASIVIVLNGITKEIHMWEGIVFILIYIALLTQIIN